MPKGGDAVSEPDVMRDQLRAIRSQAKSESLQEYTQRRIHEAAVRDILAGLSDRGFSAEDGQPAQRPPGVSLGVVPPNNAVRAFWGFFPVWPEIC